MRFVEETGGSWTAEQLRAAEAEIEQQKREWEANRLAALKKEEEAIKRADDDENELLTYTREDAKNQVNIRSKPVNPRLLTIKSINNRRRAMKRRAVASSSSSVTQPRRFNVTRTPPKRQRLATNNLDKLKKRKLQSVSAKSNHAQERLTPKRACRLTNSSSSNNSIRKKVTTNSVKVDNELLNESSTDNESENDDNDDSQLSTADDTHSQVTGPEEFDDSECSLDVMFDSTDAQDSDNSNSTQTSTTEEGDDEEDDDDDDDNAEEKEEPSDIDEECVNGKENYVNEVTNRRESIHNHVDINSPRTRSRGTVKLNLWTLDVSPILPGIKSKSKKPKSSLSNISNESIGNSNKSSEETAASSHYHENNAIEDDDSQANDEQKSLQVKQAKILDGFTTTSLPRPLSKKILPRKLLTSNGKKTHTLDSWISKSPRTRRALSPKVVLSKDDIQNHFNQVAADTIRKTRRSSVYRINSENGPS